MKRILVGLAILAVSTSAAMAKHKAHHAMAPQAAAAAPAPAPLMWPGTGPTAADKALYAKNQRESGMKK